jgi:hypothetical protein
LDARFRAAGLWLARAVVVAIGWPHFQESAALEKEELPL